MRYRRAVIIAAVAAVVLGFFLSGGEFLKNNAFKIDTVHWTGNPMPPCFQNSATCGGHIIGADENGRDELARLVVGGRVTLGVTLLAAIMDLAIAVIFGVAIRYGGAVIKYVILRIADAVACIPAWPFLIAIVVIVLVRREKFAPNWFELVILLAALNWPQVTRLASAGSDWRLALNQTARNWRNSILILSTVDFFGFGIWPPTPSWGNMMQNAEATLQDQWWVAVFPGLCIFLAVFLIEIGKRAVFDAETAKQAVVS